MTLFDGPGRKAMESLMSWAANGGLDLGKVSSESGHDGPFQEFTAEELTLKLGSPEAVTRH